MPMVAEYATFERQLGPVLVICLDFDGSKRNTSLESVSPLHCRETGKFS
jgi:hypothetical protein